MVPLQASDNVSYEVTPRRGKIVVDDESEKLTELLLDDLEDLLLVKLLGQSLNCSQSFTTIALCGKRMLAYCPDDASGGGVLACATPVANCTQKLQDQGEEGRTLNTNVNVILRLFGLSCVFVCLGEGVCMTVSPILSRHYARRVAFWF